jgi:hypothetical protein
MVERERVHSADPFTCPGCSLRGVYTRTHTSIGWYSLPDAIHIWNTVLMIACGAFGSLTVGNVKWVWWFFGM